MPGVRWFVLALLTACTAVVPRYPTDVQTSLAHDDMRRLETARFIIYYPAARRDVVDRFLIRADRCAQTLREASQVHDRDRKMVIVMPDTPFNNAFVAPEALGYEDVSVIPIHSTLDFTTLFGLAPDPGLIACHELTHYVHAQQTSGFWATFNNLFGHVYTPQVGYDPWVFEGLATHYEAKLTGIGRPVWPVFTGMFAAAYAGESIGGGDLSAFARKAPVGHHYLVGAMFFRFLGERYGERAMWTMIADNADAFTGWFWTGTFETGFGVPFGDLLDQFQKWVTRTFPVRQRPATQRALRTIGNDARYARGADGTEAWVAEDLDVPPRLTVRDRVGTTLLDTSLVEIIPGRALVQASPLLVSGLSITADGNEVWLTALDNAAVYQVPRLLRWRRGERGLTEIVDTLGPGATIDPTGKIYYYCHVDGDRWNLAAYDLATKRAKILVDMTPGTYVLGAQISRDGSKLAASVWNGSAFVIWVVDARTGAVVERVRSPDGTPVFDGSFTSDGRLVHLGTEAGRFQVIVGGALASNVPYAALAPREANGTIRFLDRERWSWELGEIATPAIAATPAAISAAPPQPAITATPNRAASAALATAPAAISAAPPQPAIAAAPTQPAIGAVPTQPASASPGSPPPSPPMSPQTSTVAIESDRDYSALDHLFYPQLRSPSLAIGGGIPHFGLALSGGDRLGLQRWALAGYVQPVVADIGSRAHYGGYAGYLNNMLAPVSIIAEATLLEWAAPVATDDPEVTLTEERDTKNVSLGIAYTWRDSLSVVVGGLYTSDYFQVDTDPGDRVWVGGPTAHLTWFASESTRYTGLRRALYVTAESGYYPEALSSFRGTITDVGGTLGGTVPLPFGRRHTISAFVRGRALIAQDDTGLLQVGGDTALGLLWKHSSVSRMPPEFDTSRFPPNLAFVEPLRGYETYAITTDTATLGELSWKYPLIIDEGLASTWFLPATFLRQLDLELFGAGAIDDQREAHYAIGVATTLRLQFLRIPLLVTYQIARRLVDDEALTQLVGVGLDIDL